MKSSKGQMESGQAYDSTKAFILVPMDTSKGRMKGQSAGEFNIGDSTAFDKFAHLDFPFVALADMELVTTGSSTKTVVHALQPVKKA